MHIVFALSARCSAYIVCSRSFLLQNLSGEASIQDRPCASCKPLVVTQTHWLYLQHHRHGLLALAAAQHLYALAVSATPQAWFISILAQATQTQALTQQSCICNTTGMVY